MSSSQNSIFNLNLADEERENSAHDVKSAIRAARNAGKISQKELAERTGIKQSNICRIEKGTYNPNIATLKAIAKGLGKELHIEFRNPV